MNLERRFFYRLVKVTYVCLIIAFFFGVIKNFYEAWTVEVNWGVTKKNFIIWMVKKENQFSWGMVITILFPIYYSLLNVLKETLIYLAFGKKFTWEWLLLWKRKPHQACAVLKLNQESNR